MACHFSDDDVRMRVFRSHRAISISGLLLLFMFTGAVNAVNAGAFAKPSDRHPDIAALVSLTEEMADHLRDVKANRQAYLDDFTRFEAGPVAVFFQYTSPRRTLVEIIGAARFEQLSSEEKRLLVSEMRETYRRYLYEWLHGGLEIKLSPLEIKEQEAIAQFERDRVIEVKLRGEISGLPDITLTAFIAEQGGEWRAFDFSFWGLRYSSGKRAAFKRRLERGGAKGLAAYMRDKNTTFFKTLNYSH